MPALTYYYKNNGCSIWRCSQPKSGFYGQSIEDQKMIHEVSKVNDDYPTLNILDCRPYKNAVGNMVKGGGYEGKAQYSNTRFSFCDIENIHYVS